MASVRLNKFDNIPLLHQAVTGVLLGVGSLHIMGVVIPGSISFNNVAMIYSASGTTAKTLSLSFGLYSLNGATLSLANSASGSINPGANAFSWITLATSATQDIAPGNWYFAAMSSTAGNSRLSIVRNSIGNIEPSVVAGGVFVRGWYATSTAAFPASIATSALSKEQGSAGADDETMHPFVLITA